MGDRIYVLVIGLCWFWYMVVLPLGDPYGPLKWGAR